MYNIASCLFLKSSLDNILLTCFFTVDSVINKLSAISLLFRPLDISLNTSCSLFVNLSSLFSTLP